MKTSQKGLSLIKQFEGLETKAYICPAGVLTIGYGSTGSHVKPGMTITEAEAEALLMKDLERFEKGVESRVKVSLNQGQFDALVSFAFNCGLGAFEDSTLLRLLNNGDYEGAAAQFDRWVKGPNGPLPGLVKRRDAEEALFRSGGVKDSVAKRPEESPAMRTITANQNTVLKKEPVSSSELSDNEKVAVEKGKAYNLVWNGKEGDNHIKVSLAYGGGNWFIYAPHWDGFGAKTEAKKAEEAATAGSKVLDVPYYSQRDNYRDASRTCFSSSCAMLTKFLKPSALPAGPKGDDAYVQEVFKRGDSTDSSVQVRTLKHFGINARFVQNGTNALLKKEIDKGHPVPVGILHHGPASAPSGGGHWLIVIGYEDDAKAPGGGYFIVNDPWGEITHSNGTYGSTNGDRRKYSYALFDSRWTVASNSDGWCILVD